MSYTPFLSALHGERGKRKLGEHCLSAASGGDSLRGVPAEVRMSAIDGCLHTSRAPFCEGSLRGTSIEGGSQIVMSVSALLHRFFRGLVGGVRCGPFISRALVRQKARPITRERIVDASEIEMTG